MSNRYRLHDGIGYQLTVAARRLERRFEAELKNLGLTRLGWTILLAAGDEALSRPSEIADFIGVDRTAISRAMRPLEADGLIRRVGNGDDGRGTSVQLTSDGKDLLASASQAARVNREATEALFSPGELATLKSLLARLHGTGEPPLKKL